MSIVQNNGFPGRKMAQQVKTLAEFKSPEAMGKKKNWARNTCVYNPSVVERGQEDDWYLPTAKLVPGPVRIPVSRELGRQWEGAGHLIAFIDKHAYPRHTSRFHCDIFIHCVLQIFAVYCMSTIPQKVRPMWIRRAVGPLLAAPGATSPSPPLLSMSSLGFPTASRLPVLCLVSHMCACHQTLGFFRRIIKLPLSQPGHIPNHHSCPSPAIKGLKPGQPVPLVGWSCLLNALKVGDF